MPLISTSISRCEVEAIACDIIFYNTLIRSATRHPESGLVMPGMVPLVALFVVESYDYICKMFPHLKPKLTEHQAYVRQARNQVKILDDDRRTIDEVTNELGRIAASERERFLRPHIGTSGVLGAMRRRMQTDLGLYTHKGHIFATTHAIAFSFSPGVDPATYSFNVGKSLGAYVAAVARVLELPIPPEEPKLTPNGEFVLKDIKCDRLYTRGPLGTLEQRFAVGISVVMAHANYIHRVLRGLVSAKALSYFKCRFLCAYHAASSLTAIFNASRAAGTLSKQAGDVLSNLLSNSDGKWISKQKKLRNILTHYAPDDKTRAQIGPTTPLRDAVAILARGRSYDEIDLLLDRYLGAVTQVLEDGFLLSSSTFWFGQFMAYIGKD
jgi:hypothetical protein